MKTDQLPFKYTFTLQTNFDNRFSDIASLQEWCSSNCMGQWAVIGIKSDQFECYSPPMVRNAIDGKKFPPSKVSVQRSDILVFEEEKDAMLFKLTWIDGQNATS